MAAQNTTTRPAAEVETNSSINAAPSSDATGDSDSTAKPEAEAAETEAEPAEPDPQAKLRKELDEQLLGAWAEMPGGLTGQLSQDTVKVALAGCYAALSVPSLRFETTAERALPPQDDRKGHVIYYRTSKGLQRFDTKAGTVTVFPQIAKVPRETFNVYVLRGRSATLPLRFAKRGRGTFLAEGDKIYLHCRGLPARP
ncbi:hypothetical protein [Ahrensia sp. R2A130]|uniref:hypothetical protein n=1 Tax=Ahrensia sp. R2A130 TaxID=744979 RepID=UPI0012EA091C|nr:hypothetical protein [Ahrensia sp. R2A130]